MKLVKSKIVRTVLIVAGCFFVGCGVAGIFLPVVPTTPFLLLAAGCFIRSSSRLYNWLQSNRLFGTYFKNYLAGRGIPVATKVLAISMLWVTIGASAILVVPVIWGKIGLVVIAIAVTVHLLRIKTFRPEGDREKELVLPAGKKERKGTLG